MKYNDIVCDICNFYDLVSSANFLR
jgi:hypothetical protein